uniref:Innexin n=1 Tax=Gongylonema pulchrum TaxID=637853 RepID=A0A183DJF3_9BILA
LVINMFNEKIFIFLWFWYFFLVLCTILSFLYWLTVLTVPMVEIHAGIIFGTDLVVSLWNAFYEIEEKVIIVDTAPAGS